MKQRLGGSSTPVRETLLGFAHWCVVLNDNFEVVTSRPHSKSEPQQCQPMKPCCVGLKPVKQWLTNGSCDNLKDRYFDSSPANIETLTWPRNRRPRHSYNWFVQSPRC